MSRGKGTKVYVVWRGRKPGVYTSWEEARAQVEGFSGARYRAFPNRALAEAAFRRGQAIPAWSLAPTQPQLPALTVDAAAPGPRGPAWYRGVVVEPDGKIREVFRVGPLAGLTANAAEFVALVQGLRWLQAHGLDWPLYTDSRIAYGWLRAGRARTRHRPTQGAGATALSQAETWLARYGIPNPVRLWPTDQWGDIPADFGRK